MIAESNIKVSPSIFAADFYSISEAVGLVKRSGADGIHYDVMDNRFVPNISFGPKFIADVAAKSGLPGDAHLMIDLSRGIEPYLALPVDLITIHIEAFDGNSADTRVREMLGSIRAAGKKAGISIKPATPADAVTPYLGLIDLVLVMSVEPGFSGQKFMPESLDKIRRLREITGEREISIQVDGGVSRDNYQLLLDAGADFLVIGSAFFSDTDPAGWMKDIHGHK
ncbi:MAG: ribulose-phosphate 3-epimerase [Brevinematales bacterium]|nr:ribulose-phosphate 3-epimerase [Brevinematales bacterium]